MSVNRYLELDKERLNPKNVRGGVSQSTILSLNNGSGYQRLLFSTPRDQVRTKENTRPRVAGLEDKYSVDNAKCV
ncbi:hypothetical protein L195_g061346 [Trifolium pratense]|uniref:Uncharacterized protein n=1 Tax=Trifolium pratense TaxID=57577 RepID=A0A2K3K9A2_TRIPR|nr:hypothetical protein L195_g061346 [Trifolium pratense]